MLQANEDAVKVIFLQMQVILLRGERGGPRDPVLLAELASNSLLPPSARLTLIIREAPRRRLAAATQS